MSGRIYTSRDLRGSREVTADVAIIGSGAGGAVSAAAFAGVGAQVVILEEGGLYTRQQFSMREAFAYQNLYQERGNRATEDLSIIVLQGRNVGGGTTVNWTTAFRTPAHVLEHWQTEHGVEGFDAVELKSAFEAVEERLCIHTVDESEINANNRVLLEGSRKLGLVPELLRRNTRDCVGSGYCGMGCPVNAKQAMHLTYLPDAISRGASLFSNTRVVRLHADGRRIVEILAVVMDSESYLPRKATLRVKARTVILAAGAINSPALLLRSGLACSSGLVGKRTFLHPTSIVLGFHDREITGFSGVPQTVSLRDGLERPTKERLGYFLETPPIHPLMAALALPGFGPVHAQFMSRLGRANALISLAIDGFSREERGGTVRVQGDGRILLNYDFTPRFWNAVRESTKLMARVALAAGAREVWTTHETPRRLASERELSLLDEAPYGPLMQTLASAHQMGGCQMGGVAEQSVVDSRLRHWDYDNLYVIDGSVLPTAAGVNPTETIAAIAHLAASRLVKQL